jgi:hypothetical protein
MSPPSAPRWTGAWGAPATGWYRGTAGARQRRWSGGPPTARLRRQFAGACPAGPCGGTDCDSGAPGARGLFLRGRANRGADACSANGHAGSRSERWRGLRGDPVGAAPPSIGAAPGSLDDASRGTGDARRPRRLRWVRFTGSFMGRGSRAWTTPKHPDRRWKDVETRCLASVEEQGRERSGAIGQPGGRNVSEEESRAIVTCVVRNARRVVSRSLFALVDADIVIDGITFSICGIQARRSIDGLVSVQMPTYKAADGSWRPAVEVPPDLQAPLGNAVLEYLIDEGIV